MEISSIRYKVEIDGKLITSAIELTDKDISIMLDDSLHMGISFNDNLLDIYIKNNGSESVVLRNVSLEMFSTRNYKELSCVLNPKRADEKIVYMPISKVKENKSIVSHLFEVLGDNETRSNTIFGFLGCTLSRNSIVNVIERKRLKISAVYNFISQEILPGEEIKLDSLYLKEGTGVFTLLNDFIDRVVSALGIEGSSRGKINCEKPNVYSIFYTYRPNKSTIKVNNKPVHIKVNGKKLYLVDIRSSEGKKLVFTNANAVLSKTTSLNIEAIGRYIEIIEENKLFNVYYELSTLLKSIKETFKGVGFYSDDYPIGLFGERVSVISKNISIEDKKCIFNSIIKKDDDYVINYDFFIKVLLQRIISLNDIKLKIGNAKVRELMSVVLGDYDVNELSDNELVEMAEDIDMKNAIIPYIERKNAFALLLTGKKNMYLAVFNLENEAIKFYCNLAVNPGYRELDGVALEVYSNTNYLISDGKLYVRGLPAKNCCLFKKAI